MNRRFSSSLLLLGFALAGALPGQAADVNVPRTITADTTWTANNTYFLSGYTFVVSPAVLTIQPGTVIKARQKAGAGAEASALVITRGAQINANGTATQPIIFTSELDNLNGNLGVDDINLWGGLVILGNASINSRADGTVVAAPVNDQIEGFSVTGGEVAYITFGGTNDDDNSGTVRYVSIRHGGDALSTSNEINGLTLGGVGRGTTIEYIEIFGNKDDGVEFFGGTVDLRYAVSAFGRDDGFDYDQGWRGRGQFWFVIGASNTTESLDKGGEWDGATSPNNATPVSNAKVYNLTFLGNGPGGINNTALNIRDNAFAEVYNSVFAEFNKMIDAEDDVGGVVLTNNVWWSHVAANNTAAGFNARPTGTFATDVFWTDAARNNVIANPLLGGISRTANLGLDPRPQAGSPALNGPFATVPNDGWYTQTYYKGAFAPHVATWMQGWTKLSTEGYLANVGGNFINISTRCNVGTGDNVAIVGFIVEGPNPKSILVRAVGKPLEGAPFNLTGVLQNPSLEVYSGASVIASNDDWGTNANAAAITATTTAIGVGLANIHANDAVVLMTFQPGAYTVIVRGVGNTSGIALVEAYAAD